MKTGKLAVATHRYATDSSGTLAVQLRDHRFRWLDWCYLHWPGRNYQGTGHNTDVAKQIMQGVATKTLLMGIFLLTSVSYGLIAQADSVRIIGDSLQGTPPGGSSIATHLRNYDWQVTCECQSGESLVGHSWRSDHITEDIVVLALLTNDAGISTVIGIRDQWLAVYLWGAKQMIIKLVTDGKRVIFVLPTLTENHWFYHNEELHLFRWFAAMVAMQSGAELIDMYALGVPLAADGLHYDAIGTEVYAHHLHQHLLSGAH